MGAGAIPTLLTHLVEVVRDSVRDVDLIGRGDDDEFILILPMSEVDDALRVGERIRATLEQRQPGGLLHAPGLRLTISGGVVGYPDDGTGAEELLHAAERTVLYAKRMGRDQIRLCGLGEMESPSSRPAPPTPDRAVAVPEGPQITRVFQGLLDALATAGDAHDQARPGHGRAVGRYARALAEACGLDAAQAGTIELAGMLHDAGKIGLPRAILGKRGTLTAEERAILREQPAVGKLMLMQIPSLEGVIPLVEYAHERYDGNGYPAGLRGNQIPFGSRIIALAEGYEAMTSDRPYRRALSHSMAITELWREAGGRYDPRLVDTFVRLVRPTGEGENAAAWDPALLEQIPVEHVPTPEGSDESAWRARKDTAVAASSGPVHGPMVGVGVEAHDAQGQVSTTEQVPDSARTHQPTEVGQIDPASGIAAADEEFTRLAPSPSRPEGDTNTPNAAAQAEISVPDNAPPVPAHTARGAGTGPPPSRELAQGSLAADQASPAKRHQGRDNNDPARPSVDDTLLLMSQTTLSRLAELDRLHKRRTGPLRRREESERDEE